MCSKEELNNRFIWEEILLTAEIIRKYFYYKFEMSYFGISSLPLVAATKVRSLLTVKERVRVHIYKEINL